ncbi:MAG TPA: hypothetical protein DDW88_00505 [Treponema sp.]|nr:hypothetical protein [Treponema sp.]
MSEIIAVGLSPTLQKTIVFNELRIDSVNRSQGYRIDASGKSVNASRVLHQLEKNVVKNICPLGEDNASFFLELAAREELAVEAVYTAGRVRSCYTLVEPEFGRATELVVGEPSAAVDYARVSETLLEKIIVSLDTAKALLIAGSKPFFWPENLYADICKKATSMNVVTMVDFHGADLLKTLAVCTPDIIKINEQEFCETFSISFPLEEKGLIEQMIQQSKKIKSLFVITRGSKDTFASLDGAFYRSPVKRIKALNAIGCGDSFNAGFLYEYLFSRSIEAALEKGNWCALQNASSLRPGSILDPNEEGEQLW